jgi:hypothetical protein
MESIDQLFNYLTWRDCKTSILTFVRKINMQTVVGSRRAQFFPESGGEFRAEFESESGVRLLLTVLCFHIPAREDGLDDANESKLV